METIENYIIEINALIEKPNSGNDYVYVEPELRPLIVELFSFPKETLEKNIKEIKPLFKKIICMHKGIGSFRFYQLLTESGLSFSEGLLMYGIDHEPYYNNNDNVFVKFLILSSRGTTLKTPIEIFIEKTGISEGHYFNYKSIFEKALDLRINLDPCSNLPENMERKIIHSIKRDNFYQTCRKAIAAAIFLGIKDAFPYIEQKLQATGNKMVELKNRAYSLEQQAESHDYADFIGRTKDLLVAIISLADMGSYKVYSDFYKLVSNKEIKFMEKDINTRTFFVEVVEWFVEKLQKK